MVSDDVNTKDRPASKYVRGFNRVSSTSGISPEISATDHIRDFTSPQAYLDALAPGSATSGIDVPQDQKDSPEEKRKKEDRERQEETEIVQKNMQVLVQKEEILHKEILRLEKEKERLEAQAAALEAKKARDDAAAKAALAEINAGRRDEATCKAKLADIENKLKQAQDALAQKFAAMPAGTQAAYQKMKALESQLVTVEVQLPGDNYYDMRHVVYKDQNGDMYVTNPAGQKTYLKDLPPSVRAQVDGQRGQKFGNENPGAAKSYTDSYGYFRYGAGTHFREIMNLDNQVQNLTTARKTLSDRLDAIRREKTNDTTRMNNYNKDSARTGTQINETRGRVKKTDQDIGARTRDLGRVQDQMRGVPGIDQPDGIPVLNKDRLSSGFITREGNPQLYARLRAEGRAWVPADDPLLKPRR